MRIFVDKNFFMHPTEKISHQGIVSKIQSGIIEVKIVSSSACSSCHAKGGCGMAETEDKLVEVEAPSEHKLEIGDTVNVVMQKELGLKAVFWAYFLPFILVIIVLTGVYIYTNKEGLSGLVALASVIPYYIGIYYYRSHLQSKFIFSIEV